MVANCGAGMQAECLAAFAVGCLGAKSPAAAGDKLGLMGGATLDELIGVLKHLETLAAQRAAKLAGTGPALREADEFGLGKRFETELLDAVHSSSIEELFESLPHDSRGHADLCNVFGLPPATTAPQRADCANSFDFTAEYIENAQDLPTVSDAVWQSASEHLMSGEISEDRWELDASAINALRSRLANNSAADSMNLVSLQSAQILKALAQRCTSRRPALAKTALLAIQELAAAPGNGLPASDWADGAKNVVSGCLGGCRGTKVVARVAEQALSAVVQHVASCSSARRTIEALAACILEAARAKPAQPPVVLAGIQKLAPLSKDVTDAEAQALVRALCEEVLAVRTLSSAFASTRAILRDLPSPPVA
mmetsp:Transcript_80577/g.153120  ORF Transcript_80577/g.153120 Transcript_80577/m.153120 type:complete len:368 (-) Transcript_80577:82-1185(-)